MLPLTLDWIVGFIEGEGSFHIRKAGAYHRPYPRFTIANTDKQILEDIQTFFGFGHIETSGDKRLNHKPSWQYTVTKRIDLLKIGEMVCSKLRSQTKKTQIKIWYEGFNIYKKGYIM